MKYPKNYHNSEEWTKTKERIRKTGQGCIFTGDKRYALHHVNYFNVKNEQLWRDVVPMRDDIHNLFHKWVKKRKGFEYFNLTAFAKENGLSFVKGIEFKIAELERYNLELLRNKSPSGKRIETLRVKNPEKVIQSVYFNILRLSDGKEIKENTVVLNELDRILEPSASDKYYKHIFIRPNKRINIQTFASVFAEIVKKLGYDKRILRKIWAKAMKTKIKSLSESAILDKSS